MNANELADELENTYPFVGVMEIAATMLRQQQEQIDKLTAIVALRELNIERMIEKQSHYEALAHAGGVEAGKELKELTDAIKLLEKYADKLEDERPNKGLSDVVLDCVELLRKAQEK
jgi:hypothetical protein